MTVPIIRKRAKRPKTRTGCLTCRKRRIKCDEQKPYCENCQKSRRFCEASESRPQSACEPSTRDVIVAPITPVPATRSFRSIDIVGLDFFYSYTILKLPESSLWQHVAVNLAAQKPFLAYGCAALGSMHRALITPSEREKDHSMVDHRELAFQQYTAAMSHARRYISDLPTIVREDEIVVALMLSLLLFYFALYAGNCPEASSHLNSALEILYERRSCPSNGLTRQGRRTVELKVRPVNGVDTLLTTFVRMDQDFDVSDLADPYLHPICDEPLPKSFFSLEEANVHLDVLATKVESLRECVVNAAYRYLPKRLATDTSGEPEHYNDDSGDDTDMDEAGEVRYCLLRALSRTSKLTLEPELLEEMENTRHALSAWSAAFAAVRSSTENDVEYMLTQLFFFYPWFMAHTWQDSTEMACDRFNQQFAHMADIIERIAQAGLVPLTVPSKPQTLPAVSLGSGFVSCLRLIITKCRVLSIRQRCLAVLRTINLQGIDYLVAFLERVVCLESERAGSHLEQSNDHTLPEHARLLEVAMLSEQCGELVSSEDSLTSHMAPNRMVVCVREPSLEGCVRAYIDNF